MITKYPYPNSVLFIELANSPNFESLRLSWTPDKRILLKCIHAIDCKLIQVRGGMHILFDKELYWGVSPIIDPGVRVEIEAQVNDKSYIHLDYQDYIQ